MISLILPLTHDEPALLETQLQQAIRQVLDPKGILP